MKKRVLKIGVVVAIGYLALGLIWDFFNATMVLLMLGAICCIPSILWRRRYLKRIGEYFAMDLVVTIMELVVVAVVVGVCIAILGCNIFYQN